MVEQGIDYVQLVASVRQDGGEQRLDCLQLQTGRDEDEPGPTDPGEGRVKNVDKKDCVRRELNPGPSLGKRRS
jgi:hypothetical protein